MGTFVIYGVSPNLLINACILVEDLLADEVGVFVEATIVVMTTFVSDDTAVSAVVVVVVVVASAMVSSSIVASHAALLFSNMDNCGSMGM